MKKILLLSLLFAGCVPPATNTPKSPEKKPPEQVQIPPANEKKITPITMKESVWFEFRDNAIGADLKYTGKQIYTVMRINTLGKDNNGYYVRFCAFGDSYFEIAPVLAYFNEKSASVLANAKRGEYLKFTGICKGKRDNIFQPNNCEVVFTDCNAIAAMYRNEYINWLTRNK